MMDKEFCKEYFDSKTGECGTVGSYRFEDIYPRFKRFAIQIKSIFNPTTILDLGCAKGFRCLALKDIGIVCYGVDVSAYAINTAPKEIRPYLYKVDLNKDNLPFKDNSFDLITFVGTIEYLDTQEHSVHEINRVLRGGGIYI
jgi:ubiquinone/menaquinone biosynthesis C-methylase UbiE